MFNINIQRKRLEGILQSLEHISVGDLFSNVMN
jgi:hypothetical protein